MKHTRTLFRLTLVIATQSLNCDKKSSNLYYRTKNWQTLKVKTKKLMSFVALFTVISFSHQYKDNIVTKSVNYKKLILIKNMKQPFVSRIFTKNGEACYQLIDFTEKTCPASYV